MWVCIYNVWLYDIICISYVYEYWCIYDYMAVWVYEYMCGMMWDCECGYMCTVYVCYVMLWSQYDIYMCDMISGLILIVCYMCGFQMCCDAGIFICSFECYVWLYWMLYYVVADIINNSNYYCFQIVWQLYPIGV